MATKEAKGVAMTVIGVIVVIVIIMATGPLYKVWQRELSGKAELREAEWNSQVLVETARAKRDSATLEAEAEVERAKGVAEANEIIGDSLKGNEVYLKYLMVQTLNDQDTELIYVPTEANLPVLEASRFSK